MASRVTAPLDTTLLATMGNFDDRELGRRESASSSRARRDSDLAARKSLMVKALDPDLRCNFSVAAGPRIIGK
jgi:hypothetical protein